jgi:uncharacterized protein YcgI (DUF1989 family)
VAALFYSREQPLERYNMADTLKAQHTAHLTPAACVIRTWAASSCSVVADTCGWHDPLCGLTDAGRSPRAYGVTRFQEQRNARYVSGREAMLVELGKYGLNERDLVANINFFSKVVADDDGALRRVAGHARADQYVDLRFEMDTHRAAACGPHPLEPAPLRARGRPARGRVAPAARGRRCLPDACPENARGFVNTERLYA